MSMLDAIARFEPRRHLRVLAALLAAGQIAAVGYIVLDRAELLRSGREIIMPVVPVDPRSLFRGDYVIMSYEADRVPSELLPQPLKGWSPVYVTLERRADTWKPVAAGASHPGAVGEGRVVLRGRLAAPRQIEQVGDRKFVAVDYGIASYFVPEKTGGVLEQRAREGKLAAVVAVGEDGRAAIKGLVIDGETRYDEPLL